MVGQNFETVHEAKRTVGAMSVTQLICGPADRSIFRKTGMQSRRGIGSYGWRGQRDVP